MIATIQELKYNLNIEQTYTEEDAYLLELLEVSEQSVFNYLDKTKEDFTVIPSSIKHAIILLASQFYENRTPIAFASSSKIPYSFEFLLAPYRQITIK